MIKELLTDKLRPKEIKHMILSERIRDMFQDSDDLQNYLFHGSPGFGKTTLALILAKKYPYKYINISDQSSVEVVRNEISDFCRTLSVLDGDTSKFKVVILDEFDGASDQFYKALRGSIEEFSKNTRFIATCNYLEKIPEPVRSRFQEIGFDPINSKEMESVKVEWSKRVSLIINKIGMSIDDSALSLFVEKNFPDMRSALNQIQAWKNQKINEINPEVLNSNIGGYNDFYKLIMENKDSVENYIYIVSNYSNKIDDVMKALGSDFPNWIISENKKYAKLIPGIIILVAQHQAQRNQVIDPVVSLLSLVYSIQKLIV